MHDLVDFLVEERYCNTESEAIRILESVSDEFYEYLIEAEASAMEQTKNLKNQLKRELSKPNPNQATILKITRQLQGLKGPLETERSQLPMTSRGLQKAPGRGGAQTSDIATTKKAEQKAKETGKPMTGARLNNPRFAAEVEKKASETTNTKPEVRIQGTGQDTRTIDRSIHTDRRNVHNKATSSTGARFPG
jgi:hypothetical protein